MVVVGVDRSPVLARQGDQGRVPVFCVLSGPSSLTLSSYSSHSSHSTILSALALCPEYYPTFIIFSLSFPASYIYIYIRRTLGRVAASDCPLPYPSQTIAQHPSARLSRPFSGVRTTCVIERPPHLVHHSIWLSPSITAPLRIPFRHWARPRLQEPKQTAACGTLLGTFMLAKTQLAAAGRPPYTSLLSDPPSP